jgi:hypothetical protein
MGHHGSLRAVWLPPPGGRLIVARDFSPWGVGLSCLSLPGGQTNGASALRAESEIRGRIPENELPGQNKFCFALVTIAG